MPPPPPTPPPRLFSRWKAEKPGENPETGAMDWFSREYNSGQPFRDIQTDYNDYRKVTNYSYALNGGPGYMPIAVCTPSLRDGASRTAQGGVVLAVLAAAALAAMLVEPY